MVAVSHCACASAYCPPRYNASATSFCAVGVFVLALTSNPEASQVQHAIGGTGQTVAGGILRDLRTLNGGAAPMGSFGAVVGATIGFEIAEGMGPFDTAPDVNVVEWDDFTKQVEDNIARARETFVDGMDPDGTLLFVDLPFLTYQVSIPEAIRNAGRVLQESGAHGVKLEGGSHMAATVAALVERGSWHGAAGAVHALPVPLAPTCDRRERRPA